MSIKRKLTLMMIGISVMAVMLTILSIGAFLIYDIRASKTQELSVTAAITGDRNGAALLFLDNERVQRNLEIFRLNPSVLVSCIYNDQGMLFAGYKADGSDMACPEQASMLQATIPRMLIALQDIKQNMQVLGKVYIVADTREINDYINKILLISGIVTLVVCSVVWLLAMYMQRSISTPILQLAHTAQEITANHDYSIEAKSDYSDETGVLARAFNEMINVVHARDIELKQANETLEQKVEIRTRQLEESKRRAEMASEAKSEFLRNMSHEFRTPLHALISFSSYGIKEYETAERSQLQQYFTMMQKGAQRLSKLVNEVLDLARMEQGEQMFTMAKSNMVDIAARSAELVQSLANEKKLTLKLEHALPAIDVVCDQDKIMQVITNLLANAIKFTPNGNAITIEMVVNNQDTDRRITVAVVDEGIGIPENEVEMIFESFRQSSRTNTGAGGTGLGLAICRSIVQAHSGRIWAQNNPSGKGARVSFTMPCMLAEGSRIVANQTVEVKYERAA
jgi:signal transduction histidine kinase